MPISKHMAQTPNMLVNPVNVVADVWSEVRRYGLAHIITADIVEVVVRSLASNAIGEDKPLDPQEHWVPTLMSDVEEVLKERFENGDRN